MSKKRRGNGEGSIYQRPDGRWCATFSSGYDSQGRRRRSTVFGASKANVQDKLRAALNKVAVGMTLCASRLKIGEFLDRWLADSAKSVVRRTTFANYSAVIKNHIKPRIGGVSLANLTPVHVQTMMAAMERKGKSAETIRLTFAVLRRALRQATIWRLIPYNVCASVERPRADKSEIKVLDGAQVGQLLAAAHGERLEAIFVLAIASGMRLGELFGLQWGDVDLPRATIMVRRTLTEVHGELQLSEPKTAKGRRRIDLPKIAEESLWGHKARMLAEGHAAVEWVFCNHSGGPLRRSHFHAQYFKPLLTRIIHGI